MIKGFAFRLNCSRLLRFVTPVLVAVGCVSTAHGAQAMDCIDLLGNLSVSEESQPTQSARAFLSLIDMGIDNIVAERSALIQNMRSVAGAQYPANPFLDLGGSFARAFAAKVELLLPELSANWPELRVHLAERHHALISKQSGAKSDRASTRTVLGWVRVPFDGTNFGNGGRHPELLVEGQTASHYFVSARGKSGRTRKRFMISKRAPSFEEIPQDPNGLNSPTSEVSYDSLGQVYGGDGGFEISREREGPSSVVSISNVAAESGSRPPITFSYPTELFDTGGMGTTFVAVGKGNPAEESLLFLLEGPNKELIRLAFIERGSWQEKLIQIQDGPPVDRPGYWALFKNLQGETLLSFSAHGVAPSQFQAGDHLSVDEVALWKFDPDTISFKLQLHETFAEPTRSVLIDYEKKSFVGWVFLRSILIHCEYDASIIEDEL